MIMKTRICTKCNEEYPLTKDYFDENKKYREGFTRQWKK